MPPLLFSPPLSDTTWPLSIQKAFSLNKRAIILKEKRREERESYYSGQERDAILGVQRKRTQNGQKYLLPSASQIWNVESEIKLNQILRTHFLGWFIFPI